MATSQVTPRFLIRTEEVESSDRIISFPISPSPSVGRVHASLSQSVIVGTASAVVILKHDVCCVASPKSLCVSWKTFVY